jgi:Uma2 family endonuclease
MPPGGIPESYWEIAPDVAVEIVSPSESAVDVREKIRDYLAAGTALVWVIYPRIREVIAHTPDGLARTYSQHEVLAHFDILPEFTCAIAELLQ